MEKKHRDLIVERLIPLANSLHNFQEVCVKSVEYELFTRPMIEDIYLAENSDEEQKKNFFYNVTKRGPEAFEKLIQILAQTDHEVSIDILRWDNVFPDGNVHLNHSRSLFTESYPNRPIGEVNVINATAFNGGNLFSNKFYKMTSKPKGLALIIVNKKFDDDKYKFREGADEDYRVMTQLFEGLGYKIYPYWNKPKQETEKIVSDFKKEFEIYEVDSCVVAISTHGEENGFVCTDNQTIKPRLLIESFNNKYCPALKGKPKMFFIQACRGSNRDPGQPLGFDSADSKTQPQTEAALPKLANETPYLPTSTDIIAVYPTQLGFEAYINSIQGSWFFSTITRVFMNSAYREEFQHLLNEVSYQLSQLRTWPDSEKQSTHVENIGWRKKLYFNPGLYS